MVEQEIIDRIVTKIGQGEKRVKIKQDLLVEGWPEGDIDLAYAYVHKEALKQLPFVETVSNKLHELETKLLGLPLAMHVAILGVCAAGLILVAVGLYIIFDPLNASSSAHDAQREADFKLLNQALGQYYTKHESYPQSLTLLVPETLSDLPVDPKSRDLYSYSLMQNGNYQLCVNFETKPVECVISDSSAMVPSTPQSLAVTPSVGPKIATSEANRSSSSAVRQAR